MIHIVEDLNADNLDLRYTPASTMDDGKSRNEAREGNQLEA